MSTFFSICITAIFSWWVWSLKQEQASAHGGEPSVETDGGANLHTHAVPASRVMQPAAHPAAQPVARAIPREHPSPVKQRRSDGVPVWTIG